MGQQLQKNAKKCGSCRYWCGRVKDHNSTHLIVESGFYEKCPCSHKRYNKGPSGVGWQDSCSNWEPRF